MELQMKAIRLTNNNVMPSRYITLYLSPEKGTVDVIKDNGALSTLDVLNSEAYVWFYDNRFTLRPKFDSTTLDNLIGISLEGDIGTLHMKEFDSEEGRCTTWAQGKDNTDPFLKLVKQNDNYSEYLFRMKNIENVTSVDFALYYLEEDKLYLNTTDMEIINNERIVINRKGASRYNQINMVVTFKDSSTKIFVRPL
jgi:hypothetical protein